MEHTAFPVGRPEVKSGSKPKANVSSLPAVVLVIERVWQQLLHFQRPIRILTTRFLLFPQSCRIPGQFLYLLNLLLFFLRCERMTIASQDTTNCPLAGVNTLFQLIAAGIRMLLSIHPAAVVRLRGVDFLVDDLAHQLFGRNFGWVGSGLGSGQRNRGDQQGGSWPERNYPRAGAVETHEL